MSTSCLHTGGLPDAIACDEVSQGLPLCSRALESISHTELKASKVWDEVDSCIAVTFLRMAEDLIYQPNSPCC